MDGEDGRTLLPPPAPTADFLPAVTAPSLARPDGRDGGPRKRLRDKAEVAEDAMVPHEPLSRVMRRALKPNTHVERSAVRTVQVCVSELVMVVVGEATEYAIRNGRRTLMAQDVLWALRELGLEVYTASLETLLDKLRAQQQGQHQALAPESEGDADVQGQRPHRRTSAAGP